MPDILDAQALYVLDVLLRKYHTLPIVGTHGFLTAAASGPLERDIDTLLPFLFGGNLPLFTAEDKENLQHLLKALYNQIQAELKTDLKGFAPLDFLEGNKNTDPDVENKALALWCTGYLHGARLDAEFWRLDEHAQASGLFSPLIILAADDNISDPLEDPKLQTERAALKEKAKDALLSSIQALYQYA